MRGFHYYQKIWSPKEGEILNCYHERDNAFVIMHKSESKNGSTVGHLPGEVSRIIKFILDWCVKVTATHTSANFHRSPLVQGGLEIACEVTLKLRATIKNHMISDRYRFKELVKDYYTEPTDKKSLVLSWQSFPMILQYEHKKLRHFKEKMVKSRNKRTRH